jgi:hypothetical protein
LDDDGSDDRFGKQIGMGKMDLLKKIESVRGREVEVSC